MRRQSSGSCGCSSPRSSTPSRSAVEAERRIEVALRRVRSEFDAARQLAEAAPAAAVAPDPTAPSAPGLAAAVAPDPAAVPEPATVVDPAPAGVAPPGVEAAAPVEPHAPVSPGEPAPAGPGLDAERLAAAQARLRAAVELEVAVEPPPAPEPPAGPPSPWIAAALRRLMRDDPRTAGRLIVAMLPAQGLVTQRALRYDVVLSGGACVGVDVGDHGTVVRQHAQPRPRREVDFRVNADEEGLARLLLAGRGRRRGARVRGARRRV